MSDLNGRTVAVKLGSPGQILQERIAANLKSAGGAGFLANLGGVTVQLMPRLL